MTASKKPCKKRLFLGNNKIKPFLIQIFEKALGNSMSDKPNITFNKLDEMIAHFLRLDEMCVNNSKSVAWDVLYRSQEDVNNFPFATSLANYVVSDELRMEFDAWQTKYYSMMFVENDLGIPIHTTLSPFAAAQKVAELAA